MSEQVLTVKPDAEVPPGQLLLTSDHPRRIELDGKSVLLCTSTRRAYLAASTKHEGDGEGAHVHPSTISFGDQLEVAASVKVMKPGRWHMQRLWARPGGRLAVIGFAVAMTAAAVKAAFSVPDALVVWSVSAQTDSIVNWVAAIAAPFGTLIAFVEGAVKR